MIACTDHSVEQGGLAFGPASLCAGLSERPGPFAAQDDHASRHPEPMFQPSAIYWSAIARILPIGRTTPAAFIVFTARERCGETRNGATPARSSKPQVNMLRFNRIRASS